MRVLAAGILLLLVLPQNPSTEIETLGESVFIGQAYPSGNVYLRPFSGDSTARSFWPAALSVVASGSAKPDLPASRRGTFDRLLANRTENDTVKSIYIPGAEAMDPDHDSCGLGVIVPANPAYETISVDFFRAMFDHCEPNDGVAVYRTMPSKYSVMVIGVPDRLSLAAYRMNANGSDRPLSRAEAVQIFEATTKEGNLTLKISTYDNASDGGHLATIYILDVLRSGQLLKTFEFSQPQGAL
jgi:hypothetical protein